MVFDPNVVPSGTLPRTLRALSMVTVTLMASVMVRRGAQPSTAILSCNLAASQWGGSSSLDFRWESRHDNPPSSEALGKFPGFYRRSQNC